MYFLRIVRRLGITVAAIVLAMCSFAPQANAAV